MFRLPLGFLAFLTFIGSSKAACSWNYPDQNAWSSEFCQIGNKQTPININTHEVKHVHDWNPLRFIMWDEYPEAMTIVNNGHTAQLTMTTRDCKPMPSVSQGNLKDEYEFAQLHFHWGSETSRGSEHTVDEKRFDAEVHFVTFNKKYGMTITEAIANGNGAPDTLAVFGAFIEGSSHYDYNENYEGIIKALDHIQNPGQETWVRNTPLRKWLPNNLDSFWRYYGGLTTPACNEIVVWTVFKEPIKMKDYQLWKFFELLTDCDGDGLTRLIDTFRYIEPTNGRLVISANLEYRLDHDCSGWAPKYDFYWRETRNKWNFEDAARVCGKYKGTPFAGLIPPGKLRHFKSYYPYNITVVDKEVDNKFCAGRYFRVNGIKDKYGVWRNFPSGRPVIFTHFPNFQPDHGSEGDTLIWDAHLNRLYTENRHDDYHAICYKLYQRECQTCPGFNFNQECTEAGDCIKCAINECACDQGFIGRHCEIPPIPDMDIVQYGGDNNGADPALSSKTDTISETSCSIPNYCDGDDCYYLLSTFIFNKLITCGGSKKDFSEVDTYCKQFDCVAQTWLPVDSLPMAVAASAETIIKRKMHDDYWWITGGIDSTLTVTRGTWLLDEMLTWREGPLLREPRYSHCSVQIDDCKVALIGGFIDSDGNLPNYFIDVYDTEEGSWEAGPALPAGMVLAFSTCSKVVDLTTYETIVVIGCLADDGNGNADGTLTWNTASNKLELGEHLCPVPEATSGKFEEISDQWLAYAGITEAPEVYSFNLVNGFDKIADTYAAHGLGGMAVTPRNYVDCNPFRCYLVANGCCTAETPCGLAESDCDSSDDCQGDLVCVEDQCITDFPEYYGPGVDRTFDCCTNPPLE